MTVRQTCSLILVAALAVNPLTAATTISGPTISPGSVSFNTSDPDGAPANGSSATSVSWGMRGDANGNWTLYVQANAPTLTLCPSVPASAIRVQCTALTKSGTGNPTGGCAAGTLALSTSPQAIATGSRQGGNSTLTATITFTFVDSWKYTPNSSCSLNLTYTVTTI